MYQSSVIQRIRDFGIRNLILSYDTLIGIIAFFLLFISTGGGLDESVGESIITVIALVSATLFAIVLTGLTIITSFTDRYFLYAWTEVGEFEGIVTLFQYNLILPIVTLIASIVISVHYNGFFMLILAAFFIYMMFSLLDLVGFISKYALQRAEFVSQLMEKSYGTEEDAGAEIHQLSTSQLEKVNKLLAQHQEEVEEE